MTAVIVLGQPRGGTSAVAGELARLGLPYAVRPSSNPTTYEDTTLRGCAPVVRIEGIAEREALWGPAPWVHKDPVAIDTLDEWHHDVPADTRWVVVFRDPWAVAESERRRTGFNEWDALRTSLRRCAQLAEAAQSLPSLVLSYERVLRNPTQSSSTLAAFVGVDSKPGAAEFLTPGYK